MAKSFRNLFKLLCIIALLQACGHRNNASSAITAAFLPKLAIASSHACAINAEGKIKCWGYNSNGQLGQGNTVNRGDSPNQMGSDLPFLDLGTGKTATHLDGGQAHSCALLNDNQIKCWGYNNVGQLGIGDNQDRGDNSNEMGDNLLEVNLGTGRSVKQFASGDGHNCAILDDDSLKCWGYNVEGQLGLGDTTHRGNLPNQMGDNLPTVNLGTGRTVKQISSGTFTNCAILDDNSLKCWGYNAHGELGLGDTASHGKLAIQMGDNLPTIDLGTGRTAVQVVTSAFNVCALLDDGGVKCWGQGGAIIGAGDANNRGDNPSEMGDNLAEIDLGTGRTAQQIALGDGQACALLDNNQVKCWGYNWAGQLGQGDTTFRGDGPSQMGDNLLPIDFQSRVVSEIASGGAITCAIFTNGSIACWGYNGEGELGLGNTNNIGDNSGEMGSALLSLDLAF